MTSAQLLALLRRRWYVVVVGALFTMASALAIRSSEGVYETRVDVMFLIPQSARYPNNIQHSSSGVIAMAGLVESVLNGTRELPAASSSGVTMSGRGLTLGSTITLPDTGGQWANNFSKPVLTVEVVGPSEDWVRAEVDRQVARIRQEVSSWQSADNVRKSDLITVTQSPLTPNVAYMSGHALLALAAISGLGIWFTVLGTVAVDRLLLKRRSP